MAACFEFHHPDIWFKSLTPLVGAGVVPAQFEYGLLPGFSDAPCIRVNRVFLFF